MAMRQRKSERVRAPKLPPAPPVAIKAREGLYYCESRSGEAERHEVAYDLETLRVQYCDCTLYLKQTMLNGKPCSHMKVVQAKLGEVRAPRCDRCRQRPMMKGSTWCFECEQSTLYPDPGRLDG